MLNMAMESIRIKFDASTKKKRINHTLAYKYIIFVFASGRFVALRMRRMNMVIIFLSVRTSPMRIMHFPYSVGIILVIGAVAPQYQIWRRSKTDTHISFFRWALERERNKFDEWNMKWMRIMYKASYSAYVNVMMGLDSTQSSYKNSHWINKIWIEYNISVQIWTNQSAHTIFFLLL